MLKTKMERVRRRATRPTHPGAILREDVLPALDMSQGEFAGRLGVSRRTVNEVLHEKRPVTPEMAHRLGKLLGNGPDLWLNLQMTLDLWDALHKEVSGLENITPFERKAA